MTPPIANALSPESPSVRQPSDEPLTGLAGSVLSGRFRHWRGASGRRYLFSVFPVGRRSRAEDVPRFADAVVLAVTRDPLSGERRILAAEETGPLPDLFFAGAGFRAALAAGAEEVHVHLLAETPSGRAALLRDLDAA